MPKQIELRLAKIIRDFMWGTDSRSTLGMATLQLPHERGGKKLLDVMTRNKAIELMKAKRYLKLDDDRPDWAKVADSIIGMKIAKKWNVSDKVAHVNIFLQALDVDARIKDDGLPGPLQRMIKTARKHNILFHALVLSDDLKRKLPIWFHIGLENEKGVRWNSEIAVCLLKVHKVVTVGNALDLIDAPSPNKNPAHKPRRNCACAVCKNLRTKGCSNSNKCCEFARSLTAKLKDHWNPVLPPLKQSLSEEEKAIRKDENTVIFNPEIETKGDLGEAFRVFAPNPGGNNCPANPDYTRQYASPQQTVVVYMDGSCKNNGSVNAIAGAGVWFGPNDDQNLAVCLPEVLPQSNNAGEAAAILLAVQTTPPEVYLHIKSDSQLIINNVTKLLTTREDEGWIGNVNKVLMKALVAQLRRRKGITLFEKVKGHAGIEGNEGADRLANTGANKPEPDEIDLDVPPEYEVPGAKLATRTQAQLYQSIIEMRENPYRKGTITHLDMTRWAVHDHNKDAPVDGRI